jgi:hypothetical protein
MSLPVSDVLFRGVIAFAADRGGRPSGGLRKTRPASARPSPDSARPEDWTGAAAGSTLWLIFLLYAASQGFG